MTTPEYWHIVPGRKKSIKRFLSKKMPPEFTLNFVVLERDFVNSGKASAEIKLLLKRLGVAPDVLRRVAIAAYEAEINVTAHSKGGKIVANIFSDCVHVVFYDQGPGMKDIEQSMVPGYSTADEMVREMGFGAGLGLPNIKKNVDMLHIISAEGKPTYLEIIIYFNV